MFRVQHLRHSLAASVVGTILTALVPGAANAQTQPIEPMLPGQTVPTAPSHATADRPHAAPSIHDTYGNYEGGFPATDLRVAVDANARAAFARMEYRRSQETLDGAVRLMQMNFERSKEYSDAVAAEKQAYQDYLAARETALRPVHEDARFQANESLKKELGSRISDEHDSKAPDKQQIVALSVAKLNYATVTHDLEVKVLVNDSNVQAARKKLVAAGDRLSDIKDKFEMQVRTSPEMAAIRRQMDDARISNIVAATYRDGAVEAANIALDYAYYRERYNFYNSYPYNDTQVGGYGSYGGYGYPVGPRY